MFNFVPLKKSIKVLINLSIDEEDYTMRLEKITNILNQMGIYETSGVDIILNNFIQNKYENLNVLNKQRYLPILLNIKLPIIIHNYKRDFKSRVFLLGPTIPELLTERYDRVRRGYYPLVYWSFWNSAKKKRKFRIGPLFPFKPFRRIFDIRAYNDRVFTFKAYDILKINLVHTLFLSDDFSFLKFKREFNHIYKVLFTLIYRNVFRFRKIDFKRGMRGYKK